MNTKCTSPRKDGEPCQAWAVRDKDPPLCAAHGGGKGPIGAPAGNKNAETHGHYSKDKPPKNIDDVIDGVAQKLALLDEYIATHKDADVKTFIKLLALYGLSASRLGRLYRDKKSLGGTANELGDALDQAMDELSDEWGADL